MGRVSSAAIGLVAVMDAHHLPPSLPIPDSPLARPAFHWAAGLPGRVALISAGSECFIRTWLLHLHVP